MAIACSCRAISLADFEHAVQAHQPEIVRAASVKKAAAVVFRATHKTCFWGPKTKDCGLCIGHIEALIEQSGSCPRL